MINLSISELMSFKNPITMHKIIFPKAIIGISISPSIDSLSILEIQLPIASISISIVPLETSKP